MRHYLPSNLKRLRALKGYSADVVASVFEVPRSTLSGWENGSSEPNLVTLMMLGEYYRMSIDILLHRDLLIMPTSAIEILQRTY